MATLLEIGLSNAVLATLLALVAAAISRVCRRPAVVHGFWLLVLLKLVTPPLVHVPLFGPPYPPAQAIREEAAATSGEVAPVAPFIEMSEPNAGGQWVEVEALPAEDPPRLPWALDPSEPSLSESKPASMLNGSQDAAGWFSAWIPSTWRDSIAFLWLAGAVFCVVWTGLHVVRFQRLLRYARRASAALQLEVDVLGQRLGLARSPQLWLVPGAVSPMLWALGGKPRLLFPTKLLEQLTAEQRATLLVHELAHWRRGDHWVRYLEMAGLALYWWHPIVWWARRELREAEEQCCDAWVVGTLTEADRTYATALLQTVAFFSQARCALPVAASGIGQVRQLRRRLTMIMQGGTPRSLSWAGFLVLLGFGMLCLPLWPVRGQVSKEEAFAQSEDRSATDIDQKIAEIKKLLQALEEKKKESQQLTEKKKSFDKEDQEKAAVAKKIRADELAKARASAEHWGKVMKERQQAVAEAQSQYQHAMQVLAKLEGKPGGVWGDSKSVWYAPVGEKEQQYWMIFDPKTGQQQAYSGKETPKGGYRYELITKPETPANVKKGVWSYTAPSKAGQNPAAEKLPPQNQPTYSFEWKQDTTNNKQELPKSKTPPSAKDKADDLDKKLDRLFKEVEELRRELRQYRPDKPYESRPGKN